VAAVTALVLILFLFRPAYTGLRNRISTSIGSALGRKVTIDNVRFHVLPRPGFALEGLVIYDDPDFSAEPMIRAEDVFAAIRFRSLLRGRLEIATLSANEPSINLVRNNQGRWNLASLLERKRANSRGSDRQNCIREPPGIPLSRSQQRPRQLQVGANEKILRADECRRGAVAGFGQFLERSHQAEPVRTDFQPDRYWTCADQRPVAARLRACG